MSDFGELALVVGDFHIPHRAAGIPEKFQRMLVPNKMQRKNIARVDKSTHLHVNNVFPSCLFCRCFVHWKCYH